MVEHRLAEVHGCHFRIRKTSQSFLRAGERAGAQVKNPEGRPSVNRFNQTCTPAHVEPEAQDVIDPVVRGGEANKMIGKWRSHDKFLFILAKCTTAFSSDNHYTYCSPRSLALFTSLREEVKG